VKKTDDRAEGLKRVLATWRAQAERAGGGEVRNRREPHSARPLVVPPRRRRRRASPDKESDPADFVNGLLSCSRITTAAGGSIHGFAGRPCGSLAYRPRQGARCKTDDGEPVHSFRTLLADLATLTRNTVHFGDMSVLSRPTPLQHRAFSLLGIALAA
jgi:hypothetical protein